MKTVLASLLVPAALSFTSIGFAQTSSGDKTYLIKPKNIKWTQRNPVPLCNDLIIKPKLEITGEGSEQKLTLTFQNQKYSVPNTSTDPGKVVFQSAAETTDQTESSSFLFEGTVENDQFNGTATVKMMKNASTVVPKKEKKKKWTPPKYNCEVSYSFTGKITK